MYTRREFGKVAMSGAAALVSASVHLDAEEKFSSKFNGVQIGVMSYSYRSLKDASAPWSPEVVDDYVDRIVKATAEDKIDVSEFWVSQIEPWSYLRTGNSDQATSQGRQNLRKWRASRPLDIFERVRKKYNAAGITLYSCLFNFDNENTDDEIEFAFDVAKALGTNIISANCTVASIKHVATLAEKRKVVVSVHSENTAFDPDIDGMVFESNLLDALKLSSYIMVTLDTGHFTAYNGDALKFVRENHKRIANLHLKDRYKNHPTFHTDDNTPAWGKGDAPIKQILQLMKKEKYPFPGCIEYEYKSDQPAVVEVKKCLDYARAALA